MSNVITGESIFLLLFFCIFRVFLQLLGHFYNKTKTKWKKKQRIFLNITLLNSKPVSVNIFFFQHQESCESCVEIFANTPAGEGLRCFPVYFSWCQFHGTALFLDPGKNFSKLYIAIWKKNAIFESLGSLQVDAWVPSLGKILVGEGVLQDIIWHNQ